MICVTTTRKAFHMGQMRLLWPCRHPMYSNKATWNSRVDFLQVWHPTSNRRGSQKSSRCPEKDISPFGQGDFQVGEWWARGKYGSRELSISSKPWWPLSYQRDIIEGKLKLSAGVPHTQPYESHLHVEWTALGWRSLNSSKDEMVQPSANPTPCI